MSKDKTDAQVAREWAARFIKHADNAQIVDADELTAARYIMATTTAPTMADVRWDDAVHAGLCAEHEDGSQVRMITPSLDDPGEYIQCAFIPAPGMPLVAGELHKMNLTPLPGTRVDLTPRREPEPESTPDHPEFLETEEDYRSAPEGTIVANNDERPAVLVDGLWRHAGPWTLYHEEMVGVRRRVLRWGWEA